MYVDALIDAHTRGILTKIEFRRALEFFHLIKIILHDDRLREDKLSNAAKRMFLEDCCNRLRELKAPTELRKLTAGEWMRGNTLTQNWKFISQDWNKLAPIIMGTFIAIAARKDGNKDLRIPLKDKRLFYLIQQNMLNDRWSHNGSPDLKAAPRNLPASRTTLAWEVAKHIWSAYGIQLQARAVEMRAEEAQRKAEEASRLAQRAKYHAERGFKRRKMDQRDWHADFSARTKQAKHGN